MLPPLPGLIPNPTWRLLALLPHASIINRGLAAGREESREQRQAEVRRSSYHGERNMPERIVRRGGRQLSKAGAAGRRPESRTESRTRNVMRRDVTAHEKVWRVSCNTINASFSWAGGILILTHCVYLNIFPFWTCRNKRTVKKH